MSRKKSPFRKKSTLNNWQFSMDEYQKRVRMQAKKALIVDQEVQKAMDLHRLEVEDEFTDWLYGSVALALHRQFGFGAKRIARLFGAAQTISHDLIAQEVDHVQIWDMVRDEVGLDITVE